MQNVRNRTQAMFGIFIVFNRTLLMMIEQKGLFPRRGILASVSTAGGSNKLFPLFWVHQRSDLPKKKYDGELLAKSLISDTTQTSQMILYLLWTWTCSLRVSSLPSHSLGLFDGSCLGNWPIENLKSHHLSIIGKTLSWLTWYLCDWSPQKGSNILLVEKEVCSIHGELAWATKGGREDVRQRTGWETCPHVILRARTFKCIFFSVALHLHSTVITQQGVANQRQKQRRTT